MFFEISKIIWAVCNPLTLILLALCIGAIFSKRAWGARLVRGTVFLFLILGVSPIGNNLLCYLENSFVAPARLPDHVDGIIVLGGSISTKLSASRGQPQLTINANRITEMIKLSKRYPQAKIVFSGGDGSLISTDTNESLELYKLLEDMYFPASRIMYEGESRNTYENMKFSKALVSPQVGENWVLVTSAFHMPRSMAIFESHGWDVIPYPAGYLTEKNYAIWPSLDVLGNYYKLQVAAKEIVGIIAYTLTERIKSDETADNSALRVPASEPVMPREGREL